MYPSELPELDQIEHQIMKSNRLFICCSASDLAISLQLDLEAVVSKLHGLELRGFVFYKNPKQVFENGAEMHLWKFTDAGMWVSQHL